MTSCCRVVKGKELTWVDTYFTKSVDKDQPTQTWVTDSAQQDQTACMYVQAYLALYTPENKSMVENGWVKVIIFQYSSIVIVYTFDRFKFSATKTDRFVICLYWGIYEGNSISS